MNTTPNIICFDYSPLLYSTVASMTLSHNSSKHSYGVSLDDTVNPLSNDDDVNKMASVIINKIDYILSCVSKDGDNVFVCKDMPVYDQKEQRNTYWRHSLNSMVSPLYKRNRKSLLAGLDRKGLTKVNDIVSAWCSWRGLNMLQMIGYEADDLIAGVVNASPTSNVLIVSSDSDLDLQMTRTNMLRFNPVSWTLVRPFDPTDDSMSDAGLWKQAMTHTISPLEIKYLSQPSYGIALQKVITGDKSDGIPSVYTTTCKTGRVVGVGPATASKAISKVFSDASTIPPFSQMPYMKLHELGAVLVNPREANPDIAVNNIIANMRANADLIVFGPHSTGLPSDKYNEVLSYVEGAAESDKQYIHREAESVNEVLTRLQENIPWGDSLDSNPDVYAPVYEGNEDDLFC